jgi:hypothetical protein
MWDLNYCNDSEVSDRNDYIDPLIYDVILSDVNHELLMGEISDRLGVTDLSPAENLLEERTLASVSGINFWGELSSNDQPCNIIEKI